MIKNYSFKFNELNIDLPLISEMLGYADGQLPEPFNLYLEEALNEATNLTDIKAAYSVVDDVTIDQKSRFIIADGKEFKVGKTVCGELTGSENLAFYICTAGKTISEKSAILLKGDDPVLGYVYDVLGSGIAEAAADKIQSYIKQEIESSGKKITNRYSPGYCNWSVADQHNLFSFFEDAPCGVTLTQSALMHPVKSTSGVIGIGRDVKFRDYQCTLCSSVNCVYRKIRGH
jgi:hypothetical protein